MTPTAPSLPPLPALLAVHAPEAGSGVLAPQKPTEGLEAIGHQPTT